MEKDYRELVRFLQERRGERRILLFRGEEERSFLEKFVREKRVTVKEKAPAPPGAKTLREAIRECALCPGAYDKKAPYGTGENGIMVILHAPMMLSGPDRKRYRRESADLVRKMLAAIGVDPEKTYITSLIKCDTGETHSRPGAMFSNCERILGREITEARPGTAIVMGDMVPLKRIVDRHKEVSWFSVDHPITLIKNPELKKRAWATLKLVRETLRPAGS
jgi:uracil-DNA glycosylase family 4